MSNTEESTRRAAKGPRIALAQLAPTLGDREANLQQHRTVIARAVAEGCDVLVFPELSLAGYRLKDSVPDVAITRDSDTWKELERLSQEISLVVGLVEETPDHLFFNSAVWFEGGRTLAVHRKTYLPTYGMFDEQRYFARGRHIAAFDTKFGRVAMLVCEDMLHPSAVTIAACDGATMLIVPSVSPARGVVGDGEADANARAWESYLQVMARAFGIWIVYCNRVGVEDGVSFWGGSEIVSPAGERVAKAAYYDEDFASAVLAEDAVRRRRIANPMVRDEDLDLTINELSRIRGRAVKDAAGQKATTGATAGAPAERKAAKPRDTSDGEKPPRRFDRRDDEAGQRPRFGAPARGGFDRDDAPRGRFGGSRDRDDAPRGFGGPRGGFGAPRGRDDAPRGGFGAPRSRDDGPRGGFGPPRDRDDGPRGGFGAPRGRDDGPRGFGAPRGRDDGPRGGFGAPRGRDDAPRGGFGAPRGRDDAPRGRFGGPPRGPGGFGGPRKPMGAPRRDDREGGAPFAAKPRFGDGPPRPRERQRPDPARKPFHKGSKPAGGKPRGRGRRDD